jgi:hypothetical protein
MATTNGATEKADDDITNGMHTADVTNEKKRAVVQFPARASVRVICPFVPFMSCREFS